MAVSAKSRRGSVREGGKDVKKVAVAIPVRSRAYITTTCSGESAEVSSAKGRVARSCRTSSAADSVTWTLAHQNCRSYRGLTNVSLPGMARLALFPARGRNASIELEEASRQKGLSMPIRGRPCCISARHRLRSAARGDVHLGL